jgi:hypothetical protein
VCKVERSDVRAMGDEAVYFSPWSPLENGFVNERVVAMTWAARSPVGLDTAIKRKADREASRVSGCSDMK